MKTKLNKFLIDFILSVFGWFLELQFIKVTALVTLVCFFITSVAGQAVSAVLEANRGVNKLEQVFNSLSIPYTAGRITESKYFGSKQVIVNVQDLHCHSEVQRNISRILSILDEKYKLNNIYLEGAYENVDTSWLVSIQDKEIRQKIVNYLIDQGKLTGAEYYSIVSEKPNIIKGIENKNLYAENFLRLQKILDNQRAVSSILSNLDYYIQQLREEYFNSKQKKLGSVISQYRSGTIGAKKFYSILKKYSDKLGIDIACYRNLSAYVELIDKEKKLNYRRIAAQLQKFTSAIKQNLPYAVYKELVDRTENFKKLDNLYSYLINLAKEYEIDLSNGLPDLYNFFDYVKLNEKINPLSLLEEEEYLLVAIRSRLCDSDSQREVTFAVNFFRFFEIYFSNKISARDYEYFIENIEKFKFVWKKYINNNRLSQLDSYLSLFNDFYKANLLRNECFVSNILGNNFDAGIRNGNNTPVINDEEKILESLDNGSEIKVVVTGGFHTEGLIKLFKKRKISYIVITPNVTTDTKISTEIYEKLAKEQRKILFQAFALLAISLGTTEDKAKEILMPLINNYLNKKTFNINSALEAIKKAFSQATKGKFTLEVISKDDNDFPNKIIAKEKVKGTIIASSDYDEASKTFITYKAEEEKKADHFSLENRKGSVKKSIITSVISGIVAIVAAAVSPALLISTAVSLSFVFVGALVVLIIGIIAVIKYMGDVSWLEEVAQLVDWEYLTKEDFEKIDITIAQTDIDNIAKDPVIAELLKAKIRKNGKMIGENIKLVYDPEFNGKTDLFKADPENNSISVNYPMLKEAMKDPKFNKYLRKVRMAVGHEAGHFRIKKFFDNHSRLGKIHSIISESLLPRFDEDWCALGDFFNYWIITRKSPAIPRLELDVSKKGKVILPVLKENPPIIALSLWNRLGMFVLTVIPAVISIGLTFVAVTPVAVIIGIIVSIVLFVALPLTYLLEFLAILAGGRGLGKEDYSYANRVIAQKELKWLMGILFKGKGLDSSAYDNNIGILIDPSSNNYSLGRFSDGSIRLNFPMVRKLLLESTHFNWLWKWVFKAMILHELGHGLFSIRFPGFADTEKLLKLKEEELIPSKPFHESFFQLVRDLILKPREILISSKNLLHFLYTEIKRELKRSYFGFVRQIILAGREILISLNDAFFFLTRGRFYLKYGSNKISKKIHASYIKTVFDTLFDKLWLIPIDNELITIFNSPSNEKERGEIIEKITRKAKSSGMSFTEAFITAVKLVEENAGKKDSVKDQFDYIKSYINDFSKIAGKYLHDYPDEIHPAPTLAGKKLLEFMVSLLPGARINEKGDVIYDVQFEEINEETYERLSELSHELELFLNANREILDILNLKTLDILKKKIELVCRQKKLYTVFYNQIESFIEKADADEFVVAITNSLEIRLENEAVVKIKNDEAIERIKDVILPRIFQAAGDNFFDHAGKLIAVNILDESHSIERDIVLEIQILVMEEIQKRVESRIREVEELKYAIREKGCFLAEQEIIQKMMERLEILIEKISPRSLILRVQRLKDSLKEFKEKMTLLENQKTIYEAVLNMDKSKTGIGKGNTLEELAVACAESISDEEKVAKNAKVKIVNTILPQIYSDAGINYVDFTIAFINALAEAPVLSNAELTQEVVKLALEKIDLKAYAGIAKGIATISSAVALAGKEKNTLVDNKKTLYRAVFNTTKGTLGKSNALKLAAACAESISDDEEVAKSAKDEINVILQQIYSDAKINHVDFTVNFINALTEVPVLSNIWIMQKMAELAPKKIDPKAYADIAKGIATISSAVALAGKKKNTLSDNKKTLYDAVLNMTKSILEKNNALELATACAESISDDEEVAKSAEDKIDVLLQQIYSDAGINYVDFTVNFINALAEVPVSSNAEIMQKVAELAPKKIDPKAYADIAKGIATVSSAVALAGMEKIISLILGSVSEEKLVEVAFPLISELAKINFTGKDDAVFSAVNRIIIKIPIQDRFKLALDLGKLRIADDTPDEVKAVLLKAQIKIFNQIQEWLEDLSNYSKYPSLSVDNKLDEYKQRASVIKDAYANFRLTNDIENLIDDWQNNMESLDALVSKLDGSISLAENKAKLFNDIKDKTGDKRLAAAIADSVFSEYVYGKGTLDQLNYISETASAFSAGGKSGVIKDCIIQICGLEVLEYPVSDDTKITIYANVVNVVSVVLNAAGWKKDSLIEELKSMSAGLSIPVRNILSVVMAFMSICKAIDFPSPNYGDKVSNAINGQIADSIPNAAIRELAKITFFTETLKRNVGSDNEQDAIQRSLHVISVFFRTFDSVSLSKAYDDVIKISLDYAASLGNSEKADRIKQAAAELKRRSIITAVFESAFERSKSITDAEEIVSLANDTVLAAVEKGIEEGLTFENVFKAVENIVRIYSPYNYDDFAHKILVLIFRVSNNFETIKTKINTLRNKIAGVIERADYKEIEDFDKNTNDIERAIVLFGEFIKVKDRSERISESIKNLSSDLVTIKSEISITTRELALRKEVSKKIDDTNKFANKLIRGTKYSTDKLIELIKQFDELKELYDKWEKLSNQIKEELSKPVKKEKLAFKLKLSEAEYDLLSGIVKRKYKTLLIEKAVRKTFEKGKYPKFFQKTVTDDFIEKIGDDAPVSLYEKIVKKRLSHFLAVPRNIKRKKIKAEMDSLLEYARVLNLDPGVGDIYYIPFNVLQDLLIEKAESLPKGLIPEKELTELYKAGADLFVDSYENAQLRDVVFMFMTTLVEYFNKLQSFSDTSPDRVESIYRIYGLIKYLFKNIQSEEVLVKIFETLEQAHAIIPAITLFLDDILEKNRKDPLLAVNKLFEKNNIFTFGEAFANGSGTKKFVYAIAVIFNKGGKNPFIDAFKKYLIESHKEEVVKDLVVELAYDVKENPEHKDVVARFIEFIYAELTQIIHQKAETLRTLNGKPVSAETLVDIVYLIDSIRALIDHANSFPDEKSAERDIVLTDMRDMVKTIINFAFSLTQDGLSGVSKDILINLYKGLSQKEQENILNDAKSMPEGANKECYIDALIGAIYQGEETLDEKFALAREMFPDKPKDPAAKDEGEIAAILSIFIYAQRLPAEKSADKESITKNLLGTAHFPGNTVRDMAFEDMIFKSVYEKEGKTAQAIVKAIEWTAFCYPEIYTNQTEVDLGGGEVKVDPYKKILENTFQMYYFSDLVLGQTPNKVILEGMAIALSDIRNKNLLNKNYFSKFIVNILYIICATLPEWDDRTMLFITNVLAFIKNALINEKDNETVGLAIKDISTFVASGQIIFEPKKRTLAVLNIIKDVIVASDGDKRVKILNKLLNNLIDLDFDNKILAIKMLLETTASSKNKDETDLIIDSIIELFLNKIDILKINEEESLKKLIKEILFNIPFPQDFNTDPWINFTKVCEVVVKIADEAINPEIIAKNPNIKNDILGIIKEAINQKEAIDEKGEGVEIEPIKAEWKSSEIRNNVRNNLRYPKREVLQDGASVRLLIDTVRKVLEGLYKLNKQILRGHVNEVDAKIKYYNLLGDLENERLAEEEKQKQISLINENFDVDVPEGTLENLLNSIEVIKKGHDDEEKTLAKFCAAARNAFTKNRFDVWTHKYLNELAKELIRSKKDQTDSAAEVKTAGVSDETSMSLKNRIGMVFYSIIKLVVPAGIALTIVGLAWAIIAVIGVIWFSIITGGIFLVAAILSVISIKDFKKLKTQLHYISKAQEERKERENMLYESTENLEAEILLKEEMIMTKNYKIKNSLFSRWESAEILENDISNLENEKNKLVKKAKENLDELDKRENGIIAKINEYSKKKGQKLSSSEKANIAEYERIKKQIEKNIDVLQGAVNIRSRYDAFIKAIPQDLLNKLEEYNISVFFGVNFKKGIYGSYNEKQNTIRVDISALSNPEFAELIISHEISHREFIDKHPFIHKYIRKLEELLVSRKDRKIMGIRRRIVSILNRADPINGFKFARTFKEALDVSDSAVYSSNPAQETQQAVNNLYAIEIPQYDNPNIGIAIEQFRIALINLCRRPHQEITRRDLLKAFVQLQEVVNSQNQRETVSPEIIKKIEAKAEDLFDMINSGEYKDQINAIPIINENETDLSAMQEKIKVLGLAFYKKAEEMDEKTPGFSEEFKTSLIQFIEMPRTVDDAIQSREFAQGKGNIPAVIKFVKPESENDDGIRVITVKKQNNSILIKPERNFNKYFSFTLAPIFYGMLYFLAALSQNPVFICFTIIMTAIGIISLALQFKKKLKKAGPQKEPEEENQDEDLIVPTIEISLKNAINPVQSIANSIVSSAVKTEYADLQGKMFIEVSESLGKIRSDEENPAIINMAEKLLMKKDIGMIPIGVTLGESIETILSTPMEGPGFGKDLILNVAIEICKDKNSSRSFPLLKLSCSGSKILPNKEIVLGRGLLVLLNCLKGDKVLRKKFVGLGIKIDENIVKSAIIDMDGPAAVLANPDTFLDQYTANPLFNEMLFVYNVGDELYDSGPLGGKINQKKYLGDIFVLGRGVDLNKLGIIASDISLGFPTIYEGEYGKIIQKKPYFKDDLEKELKWLTAKIYAPGLVSKKNTYVVSDSKIRIVAISSLRQNGSMDFGIGKITNLPDYIQNGRAIIKNFNDEIEFPVSNNPSLYAGNPFLIDWLNIINKLGIEDIDLKNLGVTEEERLNNKIDKAKILERETYIAMIIHSELVNYGEFKKVKEEFDRKYASDMEDIFFQELINYANFEEYKAAFNKNKEYERNMAELIYNEVIKFEELDEDIDKSQWSDPGYESKEMKKFLEKYENYKEKTLIENIHRELTKTKTFEEYQEKFSNNKQRELEMAKKIFERVISTNKFSKYLEQFAEFKKEIGVPHHFDEMTWLEKYAFMKSSNDSNFYFNRSMACMLQWLFAMQMRETIGKIHNSVGGEIMFEMNIPRINDFSMSAISYILGFGFDGVKLNIGKDKDTSSDDFRKMFNIDNFKKLSSTINRVNPSAKVYISTSSDYLNDLKNILAEYAGDKTVVSKTDFIYSRRISEIEENEKLIENMLLEVDAGFADKDLWESYFERIKISEVQEVAVPAGAAAGDPEFEIDDPNYRLPSDINNRPMFNENLLDKISLYMGFRPKSPELVAKMGYNEGLRFTKIPTISDENWKKLAIENLALSEIEIFDESIISNSNILDLMAIFYSFSCNNKMSEIFSKKGDERYIFRAVYETLNNSDELNEEKWPSGWLKIKNLERMAYRKSASMNEKVGCVIELFSFLRGVVEKITENHYGERIDKYALADENSKKILRTLFGMKEIFRIEERKDYDIPGIVYQKESDLVQIAQATTPEELTKNYSEILLKKFNTLYQMRSTSIILFVEALLNIRELNKNHPGQIKLPKGINDLLTDRKLMELLNPVFGIIAKTGTILDLMTQENEMPYVRSWAVNELINLFDMFAERKISIPKDFGKDLKIGTDAVKNLLGAA